MTGRPGSPGHDLPSPAVAAFVAELALAVPGPHSVKRALLEEARDGLIDAELAYRRVAHDPGAAAELALAEFGTVRELAPVYTRALVLALLRRTSLRAVAVLLSVFASWQIGLTARLVPSPGAGPAQTVSVSLAGLAALTVLLAGASLVVTRRARSPRAGLTVVTGLTATAGATFALTGLTTLTLASGGWLSPALLAVSTAALLRPGADGLRCLSLAARLT